MKSESFLIPTEMYYKADVIISDSEKRVSAAFKIIFEMKGTTKPQKVRAINKAGIELTFEDWNTIFSMFGDYL